MEEHFPLVLDADLWEENINENIRFAETSESGGLWMPALWLWLHHLVITEMIFKGSHMSIVHIKIFPYNLESGQKLVNCLKYSKSVWTENHPEAH